MLIITGTGRSGTSVLAAFCDLTGNKNLGGHSFDQRYKGGCEDSSILQIIKFFKLKKRVKTLEEIRKLSMYSVIKSPLFINFELYDLWSFFKQCYPELRVIICYRNLKETVDSFKKYNMTEYGKLEDIYKTESDLKEFQIRLEDRLKNTMFKLMEEDIPFTTIKFPEFLSNFKETHDMLTNFGKLIINFDQGLQIWKKLIKK